MSKWSLRGLGVAVALYVTILVVGLIPVNNDFVPAADGVEIFLTSNPVHADVILPLSNDIIDWRKHFPESCFRGSTRQATHVALGWGDRGFFLETPTWSDLEASTVAKALFWPSSACIHATMVSRPQSLRAKSVRISLDQYQGLVSYIEDSFAKDEHGNSVQIIGEAYHNQDAFFEALGSYNCVNTCNTWIGGALHAAGVRTGWLTPMPKTMFWYLPE